IRDVKEQEVYFGEIPLMTENGTFIINGTERVVVSQLHRSPGAFFDHDKGKSHSSGKLLYNARIIPYRGSWIDFEFDHKDILYVRIDRRRKLPATVLIRALGAVPDTAKKNPLEFKGTPEANLKFFYATDTRPTESKGRDRRSPQGPVLDNPTVGPCLRGPLTIDKISSPEEAIMEIYRRLRPGDPPTIETATNLFINLFFNPERYDLSKVGRLKLNYKFGVDEPLEQAVVTKKDILEVVRYLIDLKNGKGNIDDIDHLGNRRVRAVGELLENQYRIGLVRMERAIKE